jgi:hypothetical protein
MGSPSVLTNVAIHTGGGEENRTGGNNAQETRRSSACQNLPD